MYKDRGMQKWTGFILSEHSTMLEKEREKYQEMAEQTESHISVYLEQAYRLGLPVRVQLRMLNTQQEYYQFIGYVCGVSSETGRIIFSKEHKYHSYAIEQIVAVEIQQIGW